MCTLSGPILPDDLWATPAICRISHIAPKHSWYQQALVHLHTSTFMSWIDKTDHLSSSCTIASSADSEVKADDSDNQPRVQAQRMYR